MLFNLWNVPEWFCRKHGSEVDHRKTSLFAEGPAGWLLGEEETVIGWVEQPRGMWNCDCHAPDWA
jgi:hypothetical protein